MRSKTWRWGAARRSVDGPADAGAPARLEQGDRPQHVDACVEIRVCDRAGDRGLRGDVHDDLGSRGGDHRVQTRVAQVADV